MMKINWIHPVRGAQVALAIIVLGLMGYVSSWWSAHWHQSAPSEVSFLIFAPSWTLLALVPILLIPLRFSHMLSTPAGRYGLLALEGVTMLFWFAGFVALAVFLSDRICFGMVCDVARASAAVSALNWVVWAVTCGFGAWEVVKGRKAETAVAVEGKTVDMHQGV